MNPNSGQQPNQPQPQGNGNPQTTPLQPGSLQGGTPQPLQQSWQPHAQRPQLESEPTPPPLYGQEQPIPHISREELQSDDPRHEPVGMPKPELPMSEHFASKPEYSVDYLNSIAPKDTPKKISPFILFGGIIGIIIVAVVTVFALSPPAVDFSAQAKDLQMRIATLQEAADAQTPNLREPGIVTASATLRSTMTSLNTNLVALMKERNLKPSDDVKSTLTASEKAYQKKLLKELDDYHQLGTLDRQYPPQMIYEVTILRSKLTKLKATSNVKSVDEYCDKSIKDIDMLLKMLGEFTSTK